jgi:hypothetical protein
MSARAGCAAAMELQKKKKTRHSQNRGEHRVSWGSGWLLRLHKQAGNAIYPHEACGGLQSRLKIF